MEGRPEIEMPNAKWQSGGETRQAAPKTKPNINPPTAKPLSWSAFMAASRN